MIFKLSSSLFVMSTISIIVLALVVTSSIFPNHHQTQFTLAQGIGWETTNPPTTTQPLDRRAELNIQSTYGPVGGNGMYKDTPAPDTDISTFLNITLLQHFIYDLLVQKTNYPNLDIRRISIPDAEISFDSENSKTTFVVHFLEPFPTTTSAGNVETFPPATSTTTTVTADPNASTTTATPVPATTTTSAPRTNVPSAYEIGWYMRRQVAEKTYAALSPPWTLTPPATFYDIPNDTPAPVTQELYTPVPTFDPENVYNTTSFLGANSANAELIAIVMSCILGTIFVTVGVLGFRSWYQNKKLNERPSGMKYHRGGRDV